MHGGDRCALAAAVRHLRYCAAALRHDRFVEVSSFGIGTSTMYLAPVHPLLVLYVFAGLFCMDGLYLLKERTTHDGLIGHRRRCGGPDGSRCSLRPGLTVTVLEHNPKGPGQKLLITGKGRCNVTSDSDVRELLPYVRHNGRFLYSSLYAFPPSAAMELFESLGVPLKTERGRRVFPRATAPPTCWPPCGTMPGR